MAKIEKNEMPVFEKQYREIILKKVTENTTEYDQQIKIIEAKIDYFNWGIREKT